MLSATRSLHPLRRLLVLFLAFALVWQGAQAAWGCATCVAEDRVVTVFTAAAHAGNHDSGTPGDVSDRGDCADHMQHHATATLHAPVLVGLNWPVSEPIARAPDVMTSAAIGMPLRPPKAFPTYAL